jgi:hypothetical protein
MRKKDLHIRITERRINKLRLLAVEKDKTITQIIEDLIDTLPETTQTQHYGRLSLHSGFHPRLKSAGFSAYILITVLHHDRLNFSSLLCL